MSISRNCWDFLRALAAKTLNSHCRGHGFDPLSDYILHRVAKSLTKKKKKKE